MSNTVGHVKVGMKEVEIRAVTGDIVATGDGGIAIQVGGNPLLIDNKLVSLFKSGDRATLFWCVRGDKESNWAFGYNYRTQQTGIAPHGMNYLIAPPAYGILGPVAIFVGVFGVFGLFSGSPGSLGLVAFPVVLFWWMLKRQKKVRAEMERLLGEIKRQQSPAPPDAGAGGVHI